MMALEIVVRQSTLGAAHQALNAMDRKGKKCLKPKLLRLLDRLCKCLVTYQLFTFFLLMRSFEVGVSMTHGQGAVLCSTLFV